MPTQELGEPQKRAWGALLLAHSATTRTIDRGLRRAGVVSLDEYDVLLALEDADESRMRMSDLADAVVFQASSLTRLIDRLEQAGYVARERCGRDRRVVYAVLTPAGRAARESAWPVYRELIQETFGRHLTAAQAEAVAAALRSVVPNAARWPG